MAVSITNKAGVTFTFENGEVNIVRSETTAQPDVIPMPGSAPLNAILIDLGGVTKQITISGQLFAATSSRTSSGTTTTILQQKHWLEGLADGSQSSVAFVSTYEQYTNDGSAAWATSPPTGVTPTTVVVTSLTFTEETGNSNVLPFTMQMRVGT